MAETHPQNHLTNALFLCECSRVATEPIISAATLNDQHNYTMRAPAKLMPEFTEKDKHRFLSKISNAPNEFGCLDWKSTKTKKGYGSIRIGKFIFRSHRIAYYLRFGIDPKELLVCHTCDRRICCNPEHLFLGSNLDNNRDKAIKGRAPSGENNGSRLHPERLARGDNHYSRTTPEKMSRGEKHGNAKLTDAQCDYIKASKLTQKALAAELGVSQANISSIRTGKTRASINNGH